MVRHKVIVIHPDLGIGGAERLIVDASKALQDEGHIVEVYTAYHDKTRCFEETQDGTLHVIAVGEWIPRAIFGRLHALLAYIKMIYIAIYISILSIQHDLLLCDQVSACIPILKLNYYLLGHTRKIIFYCHFPDQLLTTRESIWKKFYRLPLDRFEEWSTSLADCILVNSKFTNHVVKKTFISLRDRELIVLYPCVDVKKLQSMRPSPMECEIFKKDYKNLSETKFIFLSLNRFERKKDLGLAIREFSLLKSILKTSDFQQYQLIIAGGYDERLADCVQYYEELRELVSSYSLEDNVIFLKSPSDKIKLILLEICDGLVYTPQNEHFGIVPIEAMAMRKPVIASASGGPLETVEHTKSGFLCEPDFFHESMQKLASDINLSKSMGEAGFENVIKRFSYETFRKKLNKICFPGGNDSRVN